SESYVCFGKFTHLLLQRTLFPSLRRISKAKNTLFSKPWYISIAAAIKNIIYINNFIIDATKVLVICAVHLHRL
ncbi:MAG TPA: hypothetical protein PKN44_15375, partial [Bacteroidales bacterium]|nr:hypothetical protein [Bacteroidales bacterium]HPS51139.1 hypothetical protein [Bacteroidales bacterium]